MSNVESGNAQEAEAAKFAAKMLEKKALEQVSSNADFIQAAREFLQTKAEGREDLANRLDAVIEAAKANPTKEGVGDVMYDLATHVAGVKSVYEDAQGRFQNKVATPEQKQQASENLAMQVSNAEHVLGLRP